MSVENAESLFQDLRNRKVPGLLSHQADMLRAYHQLPLDERDVALQLPTGSGKTLVGLLIAEWNRLKHGRRVAFLCPTRQLAHQVVEQATNKYGIEAKVFTGPQRDFTPAARSAYLGGECVAVTTYNGLFNTNPFFDNAEVAVFDDAHAAENYVAGTWSLRVLRRRDEGFFNALLGLLQPILSPNDLLRFSSTEEDPIHRTWVEKIPFQRIAPLETSLMALIDEHATSDEHKHHWKLLRSGLHSSCLYVGVDSILLRPLIPPTWTHAPFASIKQRIYMSATLGEGGELERLWGVESIKRLPAPAGWDKQGIGRRLFLFPELSLEELDAREVAYNLVKQVPRATILVTDDAAEEGVGEEVREKTGYEVFSANEIEESKKPFVNRDRAVAVMAARYDGIDFSEDECRLLILWGQPRGLNLQERFLSSRMAATLLLEDRVLTRIVQGAGRCTRTPTDYAAVVVLGYDLTRLLQQDEIRRLLHPELQAELEFGIYQSKNVTGSEEFRGYLADLLARSPDWQSADGAIVSLRETRQRETRPALPKLREAVKHEVRFQKEFWNRRFEEALDAARQVLTSLNGPEVAGYRAFWNYLAASVAYQAAQRGNVPMRQVSVEHYRKAAQALPSVSWLVELSRPSMEAPAAVEEEDALLARLITGLEASLEALGTANARKIEAQFKSVAEGLGRAEAAPFESALESLGRLLGYESERPAAEEAAPDVLWRLGQDFGIVFEAHTDVKDPSQPIGANKVRQAKSHPDWVAAHGRLREGVRAIAVLVSPCTSIKAGAQPHAEGVDYWHREQLRGWATQALATLRELWLAFPQAGDLEWRAKAQQSFVDKGLTPAALVALLERSPLAGLPLAGAGKDE
ncbi:DEAD/DEAH box helicase [Pyxidicoccus fallax]|uniref:DEAD/DEAH box helicase n=1 Tax=Pyxidicoccus fallax TaxID=394095 RepID=A0A848LI83_9BACT|nr:DEAD/DEAH box helicase [Pyxidicoccus fallax]NPC77978.1 DEAD/DEAH box helicase [Pyxidicoccus fallax]